MKSTIRAATLEDIEPLARTMRPRDVDEIRASSGRDPADALRLSIEASDLVFTAYANCDGTPLAIFGVGPFIPHVGSPWMLGSTALRHFTRDLLTYTPLVLAKFHERYPVLLNFVDVRNAESIRWLRWAGFQFSEAPMPYGVTGLPFYRFSKVQHV